MKKKVLIFTITLLLVFPLVSAETTINVETLPLHDVTVTILKPVETFSSLRSFPDLYSGAFGDVSVNFTGDEQKFHISVLVKKNNLVILKEKFENAAAGGIIDLELFPEDYVKKEEETEVVETVQEVEAEEETNLEESEAESSDSEITGLAVEEDNEGFGFPSIPNYVYYIIGLVIILVIVGLFVLKRMASAPPHSGFFKKSEQDQSQGLRPQKEVSASEKRIEEAEEKIKEAQEELNKIKNEGKIKIAEKKLREDKEELEKLRRGVD